MAYIEFDDNGYVFFDKDNGCRFSSDNSHNFLFDYVDKDFYSMPKLLEKYFSNRIDSSTFELKEYQKSDDEIIKIKETLKSAHPYYEQEYKSIIVNEIGDYFNNLLIHNHKFEISSKDWYIEKINILIPSEFMNGQTYAEDFYYKYKELIDDREYTFVQHNADNTVQITTSKMEASAIIDVPLKNPKSFVKVIDTHNFISNMLYFILDIAAQGIEDLTTIQRIWLYENISKGKYDEKEPTIHVIKRHISESPTLYRDEHDAQKTENLKIEKIFSQLYTLNKLNIVQFGFPSDQMDSFHSAVEYARKIKETKVYEKYEVTSLQELLYLEIMSMIQSGTMIRKCKNCGKYFVVNNRKIAYCDRPDESGSPCSTVGSKKSFLKKMEEDEALKIYTRAYKTHFARMKTTTAKKMTKEEFTLWAAEANEKLEKVRAGELSLSDFQDWLKK